MSKEWKQVPQERTARIVPLMMTFALILYFTKEIWLPNGYIVFGDLDFGIVDKGYLSRIYGLFNGQFSSTNFFNLSRLAFTTPLYGLSMLFGGGLPNFLLRLILISVMFTSAAGMFRLCESLFKFHFGRFRHALHYYGLIIPSLFYAVNPWVMFRIQHLFLLVGYSVYPFVIKYFLELFDSRLSQPLESQNSQSAETALVRLKSRTDWKKDLITSMKIAFFVGIGAASIHYFFYYIISFAVFGTVFFFRGLGGEKQDRIQYILRFGKKLAILSGSIFLFISYWFVPYLISALQLNIEPQNVNVDDTLALFSRYSDIKHVLYMVSYWWPMFDMNRYLDAKFWVGGGILLGVIGWTVFYRYGWHFYIRLFTWGAVFTALIALGVNTVLIREVNIYVVTKVPLVGQIFRDPNKLIGPMAFYFGVLIGFGVDKLIHFLRSAGYRSTVQVTFLLLMLGCIYLYYRPFYFVFTKNYYAGIQVPTEYKEVQSHYIPGGKILWNPLMDNMVLSNGLSSYSWNNTALNRNLMKNSGDFHIYSSAKETFTQNEGNFGMVSYFHAFIQKLLDTGGAQHLGKLLSWTGFNELGFHQDVKAQEQRQEYNRKMLDGQSDLEKHYDNGMFKLYRTPYSPQDVSASNRALYVTKGLDTLMGVLDYQKELVLEPKGTALFWAQERIQPAGQKPEDLIVGDNRNDILFPQLDPSYFTFPYDQINTGNPYTGWAKTLMKTPDWHWLVKSNSIKHAAWDYDYGHGIAYTYTPYRLTTPVYKMNELTGPKIVGMKDVLEGFFSSDNPDVLRLSYLPQTEQDPAAMAGTIDKGFSGGNLWNAAKSRLVQLDPERIPKFIRVKSVISGIHAGSMHFKVRFLDVNKQELDIAYVSGNNDTAEFSKSNIVSDAAVPQGTRYMRVDILNSQDTVATSYFWIYDFSIEDISSSEESNALDVTLHQKKPGDYRTFIRVYKSEAGSKLTVQAPDQTLSIPTKGQENRFVWVDAGVLHLAGRLKIVPETGVNVVGAVLTIPESEYERVIGEAEGSMQGAQADISIASQDYNFLTDFDMRFLERFRTFPGTIADSFVPISGGTMTKRLDLLHGGTYRFQMNGYIPDSATIQVELRPAGNPNGEPVRLNLSQDAPADVQRSMSGFYNEVKYEDNQYFLRLHDLQAKGWEVKRYRFDPVRLEKGEYDLTVKVQSNVPNLSDASTLHILGDEEITVPKSMMPDEDKLVTYMIGNDALHLNREEAGPGNVRFVNQPTLSSQWIILSLNRFKVSKGQLIAFKAKAETDQIHNVHAKLMFIRENGELVQSFIADSGEQDGEFQTIVESPVDGYLQPCFFYTGDKQAPGSFRLKRSDLYILDRLVKVESTALLPQPVPVPEQAPSLGIAGDGRFNIKDGRFAIYNEAYNPIWRMSGSAEAPLAVNLLNNGFRISGQETEGKIRINPLLNGAYHFFLWLSLLTHAGAGGLYVYGRFIRGGLPRSDKKRYLPKQFDRSFKGY